MKTEAAETPNAAASVATCSVLIADDDVALCTSLADILEFKRHSVRAVHSGRDALDACSAEDYDIVLLDISLPDISGLELITQIEKLEPDLEILVITGNATLSNAVQAVSRSTIGYLIKPIDLDRLLGILDGVGKRKRMRTDNQRLIAELERKNVELESYAYTVSHDLKSPLITITGFLRMVERSAKAGDFEQLEAHLAHIDSAARRMEALLSQLLELSRTGRIARVPEALDLNELVREAVSMVAGGDTHPTVEIVVADLPRVNGDRIRLLEAFQNLIENAIKFMGTQPRPRVEIGCREDPDETVIFVADNGIGLHAEDHTKIFGLFDKLDGKSGGTGIGLALVKRIVEVHGGRIWAESAGIGHGSTLCLTLPAADEPSA